jgi:hypothetical protein
VERHAKLDLARVARVPGLCSVVLLIRLAAATAASAGEIPFDDGTITLQDLFRKEQWDELVRAAAATSPRTPDDEYYYGVALARLGRLTEARERLLEGHRRTPGDERFPIELGGVAFREKRFEVAAKWLRRAVRITPDHRYANDFLGTIYFVQGNFEAALKYWNRVGKPRIADVQIQPGLRVDPVLLDSAFTFAPEDILRLPGFRDTRARLAGLGVFRNSSFRLDGRTDGKFNFIFAARERSGWGSTKWEALLSTLRGAAYQAIHPEYFNVSGAAVNVISTVRWDAQKRRASVQISGPRGHDSRYRYSIEADARDERWELRNVSTAFRSLRLRRKAVTGGISSFRSSRWLWSSDGELSTREYQDVSVTIAARGAIQWTGLQLKHRFRVRRDLWQLPERRLASSLQLTAETARIWSQPSHNFERLQFSGRVHWMPRMSGDDYEMQARIRAGAIIGEAPFDELFILGLERDNDLPMRAHVGTRDGRKGSAPMGRRYVLANWEFDKHVYSDGLIVVKLSPFLDTGRITDRRSPLGSRRWLLDTGMQAKLRIFGVGFTFTYGRDLRTGNQAFYVTASR